MLQFVVICLNLLSIALRQHQPKLTWGGNGLLSLLSMPSCTTQDHLPKGIASTVDRTFLNQLLINEVGPLTCIHTNVMEEFSQLRLLLPFPDDLRL